MESLNLLIAGVGGQGIITMGKMLATAADLAGVKVIVSETHGLSQRGGSVAVHVRMGNVYAPLIERGKADYIIGLEASEAVRNLSYAGPNTKFIINKNLIKPVLPKVMPATLDEVFEALKDYQVYHIDAETIAAESGNRKGSNAVLLGYMYSINAFRTLKISVNNFLQAMVSESNKACFRAGIGVNRLTDLTNSH
ncbi:indolpyruvate ferredoxin oxidoreductase [IOR] beta subunit [Thermoplasma volcanium GSS1]|uniref:Indolpyruvate ferredoxin oxidoreductase [IOR] beta subunit n=1 Tax=Thermoplasma volcanium (strain ATCC 51530 / DSM 4299 / JCM 9571 / NBRC 15438 / GSS1) TaxID=273116 RepID=Q97B82_THEVO|nr:indolepyruvate oxidoreductase subunit beta [Thermoplasma volcanium]BAB59717.1 indolpyruvate ferredoxin oxidoreductase [IOR] beta subunit [Thermoplasma volcanium GSS1]